MIDFPNAKINIGLNIVEKRSDGFHNIESLFYPIGLCDVLEIIKSDSFEFTSSGLEIAGDYTSNLCVKAYQLIKQDYKIGNVKMHLHKIIPMGAGLGGGSADGVFCISMLNELFQLGISKNKQLNYAEKLGSDCPFFVKNKPAIATGKGEVLTPLTINLSSKWIVLVNPNIHVSTIEAYSGAVIEHPEKTLKDSLKLPLSNWRNEISNGFETSIFKSHKEIRRVKEKMYDLGATYASMTGSGSTVYGIFEKEPIVDFKEFFVWKSELK